MAVRYTVAEASHFHVTHAFWVFRSDWMVNSLVEVPGLKRHARILRYVFMQPSF